MQLSKVLMPTDFSDCANAALASAVFLARHYRAELHWLHAVVLHGDDSSHPDHAFPDVDLVYQRLGDQAASEMGRLLGELGVGPLAVHEVQCRAIAAAPAIVDYAEEQDVDLIVIGTHGRRGLRRLLLGSVTEEVLRTAGCPVLTVRGDKAAQRLEPIERILVPFDFSADSESALATAREVAATFGSRIDLVHVVTPPMAPGPVDVPLPVPAHFELTREMEKALARRAAEISTDELPVEPYVLTGVPGMRIADLAEQLDSDLIVIGSHGLTGLRRFLLGSVAARVVRSAECPVLVLRRPGDDEAASDAASDAETVEGAAA